MLLVSHREKKARKIEFHPKVTVIQGENDTGKSSLLKSIPFCFGAKPHKLHKKWQNADIITLIHFTVDDIPYSIYRHHDSYSLFDCTRRPIGTYSSVTKGLGPKLAKIFNFNLKLNDRTGNAITPPPAYLLLPFYIDQDKGWTETWSSFSNLGQFAAWKRPVAGYHFGLRPDKWYSLDALKKKYEIDKQEPLRQLVSIQSIESRAHDEISHLDFNIDVTQFKQEIEKLLTECENLKIQESSYREKLTEFRTEKIRLTAQIEIVAHTHDELSDDYKYASNTTDVHVDCPTCGAEYENSFQERFEIAQDAETCTDLLVSLRNDLTQVISNISTLEEQTDNLKQQQGKILELLARKQGDLKLQDLIDIEGKKSFIKHLNIEKNAQQKVVNEFDARILKVQQDMDKFDDPDARKEIMVEFSETLRKFTNKLGVYSLNENAFKDITAKLQESGSDLPRAILAYFFATQRAIRKNGNSTLFPMIIDSPNQQEQDADNLKRMLNFAYQNRPEGQQLILGMVHDANIEFEGKRIKVDKKFSVLNECDYKMLSDEIRHFEAANLSIQ